MSCPSETRLQAFLDGELTEQEIGELSAHLDVCDECRTLVGLVQPVAVDDTHTADRIGRYVLRRMVGRGGMGVVYEAVDPELQRVVALKVLRSDLAQEPSRLLKEAQAMALLSHPNVVTIHDVGDADGRAYIVMALIDGVTVRQWLAQEPRRLDAILDVFEQLAEGLAAAHAAGLVHRDFKPENAFVARDGRVLVGDFGLAVALEATTTDAAGSLAYMAPEQRQGKQVDARSDQYSYGVSLDEALRGQRSVPRWLRHLSAKARTDAPEGRYVTMAALLEALRRGRRRAHQRQWALALGAMVALFSGLAYLGVRHRNAPRVAECQAAGRETQEVWNPQMKDRLAERLRQVPSPLAPEAWRKIVATVEGYTETWRSIRERTCQAPRGPEGASQLYVLQTRCLRDRLHVLQALTASLDRVDPAMLENVGSMLQLLPKLDLCEDERALAHMAPPPPAEKSAGVEVTKRQIASAAATVTAGKYKEGLAEALEAWKSAQDHGYLPVLASAYLWVGTAHGRLGNTNEAERALVQAALAASAGHAPETAIAGWVQLVHFVGYEGRRYDEGARYDEYARVALEALPEAYDLEAERLAWYRSILLDRKQFEDALRIAKKELALVELGFGKQHRFAARALDGLSGALSGLCDYRAALDAQNRAASLVEAEYGIPHPQVASSLGNQASLLGSLGDHPEALRLKQRALSMFEQLPGHPNHVAMAQRNLVRTFLELERLDDAAAALEKATHLARSESDETNLLLLRGELHRHQGRWAEALADHGELRLRMKDKEIPRRIEPWVEFSKTNLAAGAVAEAEHAAREALPWAVSVYGEDSCRSAEVQRVLAEALVEGHRWEEARPFAEKALETRQRTEGDPVVRARAEFTLARVLEIADRPRAQTLATDARQRCEGRASGAGLQKKIDAWLGERGSNGRP